MSPAGFPPGLGANRYAEHGQGVPPNAMDSRFVVSASQWRNRNLGDTIPVDLALPTTISLSEFLEIDEEDDDACSWVSDPEQTTGPGNEAAASKKERRRFGEMTAQDQNSAHPAVDGPAPKTRQLPRRAATKLPANGTKRTRTGSSQGDQSKKRPQRRKRSLERNREAASKCRKRKKAWIEELEVKKTGLEGEHSALQAECMSLVQEVSALKNLLIVHSGCHDTNINAWINHEAAKFAARLKSRDSWQRMESLPFQPAGGDAGEHCARGGGRREVQSWAS